MEQISTKDLSTAKQNQLGFVVALIVLDQAIKQLIIRGHLYGIFGISVHYNDKSITWAVIASLLIIVLATGAVMGSKGHMFLSGTGLVTILAGGLSNMIDYIQLQAVIDTFNIASFHFNLADAYVVIGGGIIVSSISKNRRH